MDQTPVDSGRSPSGFSNAGVLECSCGKKLRLRPELLGKKIRCPGCQKVLTVAAPDVTQATQGNLPSMSIGDPSQATLAAVAPSQSGASVMSFLAPPQKPEEIGRLGGYRVLSVLGQGGMGVVFKAEEIALKRLVALKAMLPAIAASTTARERFIREAQAAAALKHDHIVSIFQVGEDRGAPFLAMEFLEGESLDSLLKRVNVLPLDDAVRIGREVALGLAAAHKRGLIHRDIKPGNIWLDSETGRAKILDFGLARVSGFDGDAAQLTQSGMIVGTPAYMPPEQASAGPVDPRCDLYSLGVLLYRMTTGELPIKGATPIALLSALALETPAEPSSLNPEIPADLNDLIVRLLAKKPDDRPASARDVANFLGADGPPTNLAIRAGASPKTTSRSAARSTPVSISGIREKAWTRWIALAGTLVVTIAGVVAGFVLWPASPVDRPIVDGPQPKIVQVLNPFDALRRADIAPYELRAAGNGDAAQAPAELVAVLGQTRFQHSYNPWLHSRSGLAVSPDGKLIAALHAEEFVRVWDSANGELIQTLPVDTYADTPLVFAPDATLYAAQHKGTIRAWEPRGGAKKNVPFPHLDARQVTFSRDGQSVLTCDDNGRSRLSRVDGTLLMELDVARDSAAFLSPDGKLLCVSKDGYRLWSADNRDAGTIEGVDPKSSAGTFSPDGTMVVAQQGNNLAICDVATRKIRHCIAAESCLSMAFSPDSRYLATAGLCSTIEVWELTTGERHARIDSQSANVRRVAFSTDQSLVSLDCDGRIRRWNLNGNLLAGAQGTHFHRMRTTPDGIITHGGYETTAAFSHWDLRTREPRMITKSSLAANFEVSSDGKRLAFVVDARRVVVIDTATGAGKTLDTTHDAQPITNSMALSPDGTHAAMGGSQELSEWDIATGQVRTIKTIPAHFVSMSNDRKIAVGGDGNLAVFDLVTQKAIWTQERAHPNFFDLQLSRAGNLLAATCWNSAPAPTVVLDAKTGARLKEFPFAQRVAFSHDGEKLATVAESLAIWNPRTGERERTIKLGRGQVPVDIDFASDGRHVALLLGNGAVHIYRLAEPAGN